LVQLLGGRPRYIRSLIPDFLHLFFLIPTRKTKINCLF